MFAEGNESREKTPLRKTVSIPLDIYESELGRYFTAETRHLTVGGQDNAWGALFNPPDSGVNLQMSVVTLNYISGSPMTIGFFMNAKLLGEPRESRLIAPANTAIRPLPESPIHLLYASEVSGIPRGGVFTLSRTAYPNQITVFDNEAKFIVPPGGNYCAFLSPLDPGQDESEVYLAFGFWVVPV
jgi:hypothetical protein